MSLNQNTLERFYSLDVLRGVAALSIVFFHWRHFFFSGTKAGTFDLTKLPFSEWMLVLYTKGDFAVDLFFSLSGFIFYWLYSKRISENAITPSKFALLRFSRLYPLHFATLLIVAISQIFLINFRGIFFVYQNNDIKYFLLNLFFASSWGTDQGFSFNGPIWSVSVEILLYIIFFVCCRLLPVRAIVLVIISIIGFHVVQHHFSAMIGRGIGSFFLGGCVSLIYKTIISTRYANSITQYGSYLMVSAWVATLFINIYEVDLTSLSFHSIPFLWRFDTYFQWGIHKLLAHWTVKILFPLTILSLALIETRRGTLGKRISFIGDISYSSYLLHFPLQLLFYVVVTRFTISNSIYYTPWFMVLFFTVLIIICLISFRYFEIPAQRFLRQTGKVININ